MTHIINVTTDLSECELAITDDGTRVELVDTRDGDETFGTIAYFSSAQDAIEYASKCNGNIATVAQVCVEYAIEEALGEFAVSNESPCGGTGYYDAGEEKPYRVLFCDGAECESFKTLDEAVEAAEGYADEMRAEQQV